MKKEKSQELISLSNLKNAYSSSQCTKRKVTCSIMKSQSLQKELEQSTSFLDRFSNVSLEERIWHFINDKHSPEICPFCNKNRKRFYSMSFGLLETCCSDSCKFKNRSKSMLARDSWDIDKALKKKEETCLKKYGETHPMKTSSLINKRIETIKNNDFYRAFKRQLKNLGLENEFKEDYIPKLQIKNFWFENKNIDFVLLKTKKFTEKNVKNKFLQDLKKNFHNNDNINLIFIWQDDWENPIKQQIILSRIQSKLGLSKKIYARNTKFSEIDGATYKKFCDENHLQGHAKASFKFGLLLGSDLVEVISFDHPRHAISRTSQDTLGSYELIRLCTKSGYEVVGGFSKLMKHAQEAIPDMKHVKSFIDLDWSSLEMTGYEKIGFKKIRCTDPNYWWVVNGIRMNRLKFTKKNLMKMFPETDMKKSESEIMHDHDWWKIYGSGNILMEIII